MDITDAIKHEEKRFHRISGELTSTLQTIIIGLLEVHKTCEKPMKSVTGVSPVVTSKRKEKIHDHLA